MKCIIVGAGDFSGFVRPKESTDILIAADAGYDYCIAAGVCPDIVIGDFDSRGSAPAADGQKDKPEIITVPCEKDDTDLHLALHKGMEMGFDHFDIYGGLGGRRFSHTMANIQILAELSETGKQGILYGKDIYITAVTDGAVSFDSNETGILSVFSLSDISEGVTISGAKYLLNDAVLKNTFGLGVSNRFIPGQRAVVSVRKGTLLIVNETAAE